MPLDPKPTEPTVPPAPVRGEDRETFKTKSNTFVAFYSTLTTYVSDAMTWMQNAFTQTESEAATAVSASATAVSAKDEAVSASASASADAASAANSAGSAAADFTATSATSTTIGTGSKALTIETGKAFIVGQSVQIVSDANISNKMSGDITAHDSGTGSLTVDVTTTGGSGTFADWSIALTQGLQSGSIKTVGGVSLVGTGDVPITLAEFSRACSAGDVFTVPFARTGVSLAVSSIFKEVPGTDLVNNIFSGLGGSDEFEFDNTKIAYRDGAGLTLKPTSEANYGISSAVFDGKTLALSAESNGAQCIRFNSDGTKLFALAGSTQDSVFEYALEIPYDISSTSYTGVSFSVAAQTTNPSGMVFSPDGTKMFISESGDSILQYSLSVPFLISTASYDSVSFSVVAQINNPRGMAFNLDGTKLLVASETPDEIFEYSLTTGYDLSTVTYSGNSFSVTTEDTAAYDVAFNSDGTKMFVAGSATRSVHQYSLTTGFDLTTAVYDSVSFSARAYVNALFSLTFNGDGSKIYLLNPNGDNVFQFTTIDRTFNTGTYEAAVTNNPIDSTYWVDVESSVAYVYGESSYYALSNDDRAYWFVLDASETPVRRDIVRLNGSTWEYNSNATWASETWTAAATNSEISALEESMSTTANQMGDTLGSRPFDTSVMSYDGVSTAVQGSLPRGIHLSPDGTKMFTIESNNDDVHQYTLSVPFDVGSAIYDSISLSVASQDTEPTDLWMTPDGSTLFVLGKTNDSVYTYVLLEPFDLTNFYYNGTDGVFSVTTEETSPEGLAFNSDGTKMFIVGGSDTVYQYSLTTPYAMATASYDSVSFSVTTEDTSPTSVSFNSDGTRMFILGASTDSVHQYSLTTGFDLTTASYDSVSFSVSSQEPTPQGMAFSYGGDKLYVVGTGNDTAYQYSVSTPADIPLQDDLSLAVILRTDSTTDSPVYENTFMSYRSLGSYEELDKSQYTVVQGTDEATIKINTSGNIKGRFV